jgi:hypothetical protein
MGSGGIADALPKNRGHCRSGNRVAEIRPMPPDPAQNAYGNGDENLPPEPAARLSVAKSLDEIARQGVVVATRTRVS